MACEGGVPSCAASCLVASGGKNGSFFPVFTSRCDHFRLRWGPMRAWTVYLARPLPPRCTSSVWSIENVRARLFRCNAGVLVQRGRIRVTRAPWWNIWSALPVYQSESEALRLELAAQRGLDELCLSAVTKQQTFSSLIDRLIRCCQHNHG